ncbi:MAG: hypothetical protein CVT88_01770 [Candidatus Altiarchaeales archaeon HGW-Altiarchaeales-1]|nr:MAG: hypothetical protein CVT88_01770 [Candidatus Altiarchaeales archaeon HGW-Altiarchaeales-1]
MINTNIQTIYAGISQLTHNEKILVLYKLALDIYGHLERGKKINIYDIKGVGKEIWEGIDAQEYVNEQRESWK